MNSNPTTILITGYQLQKALAYVAPDLTRAQLEDMVAIQASPSDGQLLAGTATLAGEENLIIDLDGDFMWPRQHPDDRMVDQWASDVKDNMAKRAGRNRRDPAHQGRLADGWVSGVFQSCGWDAQNWTARQISAGLVEHLYRQDMLEVAIHALVLRERDQRFDRRQLRETIPPQALTVAAQMRLAAKSMSQPGHPEIDADQLIAWADQIEAARDVRSNTEQLAAAPFMFEALLADHNAVLAERAHNALVQQAKAQGWFADQQHPGQEAIRHAAQQRWEQELLAFDLKRKALQLATPVQPQELGDAADSASRFPSTQKEHADGAQFATLCIDVPKVENAVAATA